MDQIHDAAVYLGGRFVNWSLWQREIDPPKMDDARARSRTVPLEVLQQATIVF